LFFDVFNLRAGEGVVRSAQAYNFRFTPDLKRIENLELVFVSTLNRASNSELKKKKFKFN
jgi:hypothetical protein